MSSEVHNRISITSIVSSIVDSVDEEDNIEGDICFQPKQTKIEIQSKTKNENVISQSTVSVGSSMQLPAEATAVNISNVYYNSFSNQAGEVQSLIVEVPQETSISCTQRIVWTVAFCVFAPCLIVLGYFFLQSLEAPKVRFIPRKEWQLLYEELPNRYLNKSVVYDYIETRFACMSVCKTKVDCIKELNSRWNTKDLQAVPNFVIGDDSNVYEFSGFDYDFGKQQEHKVLKIAFVGSKMIYLSYQEPSREQRHTHKMFLLESIAAGKVSLKYENCQDLKEMDCAKIHSNPEYINCYD